jgi:sugar lactone lactonase YvrE
MKVISTQRCIIGESPIWDEYSRKLYQVDGFGKKILCIDISSKEIAIKNVDFTPAAIAFTKKHEILVSCLDGAFILNDDGKKTPIYDISKHSIKYGNDAKVGPDGRFYVGTQSSKYFGASDEVDGKLYSIDADGKVKVLLDGLLLSNGFDWSVDEKRFYHTDSGTRIIKEYKFDRENGSISETGRQLKVDGIDGFTIDHNDCLYIACWGLGHIAVVDTKTMEIIDYIKVPTVAPASCAFAGKNMDKLAIVTASFQVDETKDNLAGFTFIYDAKTYGRKPYLFG